MPLTILSHACALPCPPQVVAYDFGIKHNILRRLASFGCRITVVPASWPASEVLKMNPDGVFFSNGPVSHSTCLSCFRRMNVLVAKPLVVLCGHGRPALMSHPRAQWLGSSGGCCAIELGPGGAPRPTPSPSCHLALTPPSHATPLPQGDPSAAPYAVENAKAILGKKPVFGICMGHQILGQAFGGKTFKLKFGHHGGNHPIRAPGGRIEVRVCVFGARLGLAMGRLGRTSALFSI